MQDPEDLSITPLRRLAWNKGKLIGAKPPLRPKHVWAIRTKLQVEGRIRELAMFNLAIDSKLRGCDVVGLKLEDIAPNGYAIERATVRQKKTGQPVRFELTEQTRQAVDEYVKVISKKPGEFLFSSRRNHMDEFNRTAPPPVQTPPEPAADREFCALRWHNGETLG